MSTPNLPLSGIRIVDFTQVMMGPVATQMLADYGADVIKIEDLGLGDYASSTVRELINRNKRGIRIDLKQAEGVRILLDLCAQADVLVCSVMMCALLIHRHQANLTRLFRGEETRIGG